MEGRPKDVEDCMPSSRDITKRKFFKNIIFAGTPFKQISMVIDILGEASKKNTLYLGCWPKLGWGRFLRGPKGPILLTGFFLNN